MRAGYGDNVVLEDVSASVASGGCLAVLGRNGVGKTTLLSSVMGLTQVHHGHVTLQGLDLTRLPPHARAARGLALVPQEREIFASLSVHENLLVARRPGAWTPERVYELFPRLLERQRNMGNQLSGGEQQMLAVGRALAQNPQVLLLDEPFEGLAPLIVEQIAQALKRLRSEHAITMVLVEQHAELALELSDTAIVLDRGQVVWRGASADLAADSARLASLIGFAEQG
nr:ABC transporter ATP-binding protein [Ramlibacter aurantiacus]